MKVKFAILAILGLVLVGINEYLDYKNTSLFLQEQQRVRSVLNELPKGE